jgi:hypothetical protein
VAVGEEDVEAVVVGAGRAAAGGSAALGGVVTGDVGVADGFVGAEDGVGADGGGVELALDVAVAEVFVGRDDRRLELSKIGFWFGVGAELLGQLDGAIGFKRVTRACRLIL